MRPGDAQWQVTNNQLDLTSSTALGNNLISRIEHLNSRIYAAGPAVTLLTKYGLFSLRYYDEFGANATSSGQQLIFGVAIGGKPR